MSQFPLHHVTYAPAKSQAVMFKGSRRGAFDENTLLDNWLVNVAQYPLHHVTYAPAKFEVAMS